METRRISCLVLIGFGALISSPPCDAQAPKQQVYADLGQIMKGIMFPASNVIFATQKRNPADVTPSNDPSTATDLLDGSYGKWEAVENSALAIAESANLLILPGRKCLNGRDVPVKDPDWPRFVKALQDAAMTTYKAAKSRNPDKVIDAAATLNLACANCHDKYRVSNDVLPLGEKPGLPDRCKSIPSPATRP